MSIDIVALHAFTDNFIWLIRGPGCEVAVVDPGDATPVIAHLEQAGLRLGAILITHQHADHTGGIAQLVARYPDIAVYGPSHEAIDGLTHRLGAADRVALDAVGIEFTVLDVPGHTAGHIAYHCTDDAVRALFCGDTLFSVGCGRVFSGTFDQLHDSLMRIDALDPGTRIYCAHEYTLDNIGFAKWVEPRNAALLAREREAHAQLAAGRDTVPSTLGGEQATNPFLRLHQPTVIAAVERHAGRRMRSSRDTFRALRRWKDTAYD